jgi:hypothetical protein
MTYSELIETISLIVETEKIKKVGLTLLYELEETVYDRLNEEVYIKTNPYSLDFKPEDEFEVFIGGILVKFVKKK